MDLVALAEAMDCDGVRVDSPAGLEKALAGFGTRSRPLIVEARVDPAQYEAQFYAPAAPASRPIPQHFGHFASPGAPGCYTATMEHRASLVASQRLVTSLSLFAAPAH